MNEHELDKYYAQVSWARAQRDKLLAESDYMAMPDYPNPPQGLSEYRQKLRDIPEQSGFPFSVKWPYL